MVHLEVDISQKNSIDIYHSTYKTKSNVLAKKPWVAPLGIQWKFPENLKQEYNY